MEALVSHGKVLEHFAPVHVVLSLQQSDAPKYDYLFFVANKLLQEEKTAQLELSDD
jgi:hypothetical protein